MKTIKVPCHKAPAADLRKCVSALKAARKAFQKAEHRRLFEFEGNLLGIGLGPKRTGSKHGSTMTLRFYVARKPKKGTLSERSDAPWFIPKALGDLATDVIETGRIRAFAGGPVMAMPSSMITLTDTRRNIDGVELGTLGALVTKDGQHGFLTCNHVAGLNGRVPAGNPIGIELEPGQPVPVGTLAGCDRLSDAARAVNLTDSALVMLAEGVQPVLDLSALGPDKPAEYVAAAPRRMGRVIKFGPASKLTRGQIVDLDFDPVVSYDFGTYPLSDQIVIQGDDGQPFASEGDSGSLVFSDDEGEPRRPVAMIWGGRRDLAYATPLVACLKRHGVALVERAAGAV